MSEQKIISPLLDGFAMGNPMSDHDGVRCCPAIKENSQQKYIVKIISIPSSQVQMDALLLAGAYKDASEAMDYFKTVVDDVYREAELLQKLAQLEGFLGYEGWQMEPITRRRLGYEVYLLGEYRRSLDKFVRKNPITHLQAINLGLDMCSALSVCRQAGALYVDLKPTNIFVSDKKEYRIGDLGFVSLDALSYTALPDKYRSPYTPPELLDPMASVGMTTDTYALGMILYQIYNDGQLPPADSQEIPSPAHADYELAEVILKAISADPEARWQDPREMGQALVAYMQRNAVNDVPITPYIPLETPEEPAEAREEAPAETPAEDETVPGEEDAQSLMPHEMSDELSKMVAKADDLIAHEPPAGIEVPQEPEPEDPFAFAKEDEVDDSDVPQEPLMEEPPEDQEKKKPGSFASGEGKKMARRFLANLAAVAVVAGVGFGTFWCYQNLYLQTVNGLSITGDRSQLTVSVDSKIHESLLHVSCADQYGNVLTQDVINGQATFGGLNPNTMYTVSLDIDGFHKLVGKTSEVFTTDTTTRIVSFTSVAGSEDGTLILNFTVDGDEPEQWQLTYSAPGEEAKTETFTGHSLTLEGLKVGKVYTFTLDAGEDLSLGGKTTLDVMAARLILAEDINVTTAGGGDVTVRWKSPGDIVVDSWKVRCYSDSGYEQEFTVQDTEAYFTGLDSSVSYTVEIVASGMTQAARASITASPITVTDFRVEEQDDGLTISWDYDGDAPEGGWLLLYSVDGSAGQSVLKSDTAQVVLMPRISDAKYRFELRAADGVTVFNSVQTHTSGQAPAYEKNGLAAGDVTARLLKTPEKAGWRYESLSAEDFTSEFTPGESISVVLESSKTFYHPGEQVSVLFVIRDADGRVISSLTGQQKKIWKEIWEGGDTKLGELDVPNAPDYAGDYTLNILIDGQLLAEADFTIIP
ncbi:MAG: fibronectin type III domain-containing protein [Eubacteriales bacterium]|nr:fibronectin type III domain-containing protein [Eubacteriales bacterium]